MADIIVGNSPPPVSGLSSLPWWLQSIVTLGVPAAIALYLVYALVAVQSTALISIKDALKDQGIVTAAIAVVAKESADAAKGDSNRTQHYLRLLCVNQAKTLEARTDCLNVQ